MTCTTYYGPKTTAKDLALFKARAKAACAFASTKLIELGRSPVIASTAKKTTKTADFGKVWLTFKG